MQASEYFNTTKRELEEEKWLQYKYFGCTINWRIPLGCPYAAFVKFWPPNCFKFLWKHNVMCFLLSAAPCLLMFGSLEAIITAQ